MGRLIFKEGKKYTFSDYFELNNLPEEIAGEFGYQFDTQVIHFAAAHDVRTAEINHLQSIFYENLPKISLNSEMAKRDFMIAPILWEIIRYVKAKINVEYAIDVDDKLSGLLDYLIYADQSMIVIEAKKGDLDKGFNQLIAELIALDKYQNSDNPSDFIYGAVSIGEVWRFGVLNRVAKTIVRDLHTYRVPEDVSNIFSIIMGILSNDE